MVESYVGCFVVSVSSSVIRGLTFCYEGVCTSGSVDGIRAGIAGGGNTESTV